MGVLDSPRSRSPEFAGSMIEFVGTILDMRGIDLLRQRIIPTDTLDPLTCLRPHIQQIIVDNNWSFGGFRFGEILAASDVNPREFCTLFDTKKEKYIVIAPPLYGEKGEVLRRGTLR